MILSVHVNCGQSFSNDSAIHYVFLVLWMTSRFYAMGQIQVLGVCDVANYSS